MATVQRQQVELETLRFERMSLQSISDGAQQSLSSCMNQLADLRGTYDRTLATLRAETARRGQLEEELAALQAASRFQLTTIETLKDQLVVRECEARELNRRLDDLQRLNGAGEEERGLLQTQVGSLGIERPSTLWSDHLPRVFGCSASQWLCHFFSPPTST